MSATSTPASPAIELGGVTPIVRVADLAASIEYYVNRLGFKVLWGYPEEKHTYFASIARGKCNLFLCAGDQGHPGSWVWIDGKNVDALYEEFMDRARRFAILPQITPGRLKCR